MDRLDSTCWFDEKAALDEAGHLIRDERHAFPGFDEGARIVGEGAEVVADAAQAVLGQNRIWFSHMPD